MPRSEHTFQRQLTSCLALAIACGALSGCGQSSRSFLARLGGKSAEAVHALAGPASKLHRAAAGTADEDAHPHLIRDPFLEQTGAGAGAGTIFQTSGERAPGRSQESTDNTASMTPADQQAYLDGQLERLAAAMQETAPRVPPQRDVKLEYPWAFGDAHTGHSTPVSAEELRRKFDQLASREPVGATSRGWTAGGQAAGAARFAQEGHGFGSVAEELAPAPHSGKSHLAMIVDSQLVPPRFARQWSTAGDRAAVEFAGGPALPRLPADRREESPWTSDASAEAFPPPEDAGIGRTALGPGLPSPFDHKQPVGEAQDEAALLPEIKLAMNVDAPGPAAPQVANTGSAAGTRSGSWRGPSEYVYRGDDPAGDWMPRTLEPIDFGDRPQPAKGAALSWFPGWLATLLGVLLLLLAGTALRRGAFRR